MAKRKKYRVTVVNPRRRKATKKRTKKRTAKKRTAKKATKRTTRKRSTMPKRRKRTTRRRTTRRAAPRARRRTSRRRTRSNPSRARRAYSRARNAMMVDPLGPWNGMLARVAGKVASVWAVKRWGDGLTNPNSPTTGGAWTFKNYLIALASGYFGGELAARMINKKAGNDFYQGASDFIATKLTWSELVMRWNWTSQQLGSAYPSFAGAYPSFAGADVQQLMAQARPGDIVDDGHGNRLLLQPSGQWVAMMGADMGNVVEAGPLGDIVEAGPLGNVVEAGPLGHMMAQSATRADNAQGVYTFRGSKDRYSAAFM